MNPLETFIKIRRAVKPCIKNNFIDIVIFGGYKGIIVIKDGLDNWRVV